MATTRIAVIGGGPAGSTLAGRAASAGLRVDLFEERPSGEKPCGGGIPAAALLEFPELASADLPRRVVRRVLLYSPHNRSARLELPNGLHMFRRRTLDSFLRSRAEAAGARMNRGRVRVVHRRRSGTWTLDMDGGQAGPYDVVIGADGARSVVRRALGERIRDDHTTLALYGYVHGIEREEVILKFFGEFDGYLWAFPRTDHVSIGICATFRSVTAERLREEMHRFIDAYYPEGQLSADRIRGYFIPCSPRPLGAAGREDGWALVGDAAGFADPLTREGIAHAMRSAALVADELVARHEIRTPSLPEELAWAHRHGAGFYAGAFLESLTRLADASSSIRAVLEDLLEGRQTYRGLRRRLLRNALPCGLEAGAGALITAVRTVLIPAGR